MPPESSNSDSNADVRGERRALGWAALAAIAIVLLLARPVGTGVLLGALMAFTFQPMYERVVRRWPPPAAALATVVGSTLAIAFTFGGILWLLVRDGTILGRQVVESLGPGGGAHHVVTAVSKVTGRVGITAEDSGGEGPLAHRGCGGRRRRIAEAVASTTASTALALFFLMLSMYFILREWATVSATAEDTLPLRPQYTRKLFEEFHRVGRTTLLSTLVTGLVQGTLATVGYWIAGLPYPLFFGALSALVSPIPGVGTMLVWVPAGIVLILLGHVGRGIVLLVWGVLVVTGIPDYVVRPRVVGHGDQTPALLTFIALFGGAQVFGLKGLIVGPLLMAIAIAVLRLYADEARARKGITPAR